MKNTIALISLTLILATSTTAKTTDILAIATHDHNECNFFPANRLRFPIKNDGKQISRPQFRKILDAAESVYKPIFQSLGLGRFYVVDRWSDDTVNACASSGAPCSQTQTQIPGLTNKAAGVDRYVEIYGGLARHPYMTPEGLMLVVCHEIGHHLGGYPRYKKNTSALSTEGQADYFATAKCARLVYGAIAPNSNQNWLWTNKDRIPAEVKAPCSGAFGNTEAAIYCMRSSLAGLSLAQTLGSLSGTDPRQLTFVRKDTNLVQQTFENHPKAQCRLDTYVAGALCGADPRVSFSATNPAQGACVNNLALGTRPACWYKDPLAGSGLASR